MLNSKTLVPLLINGGAEAKAETDENFEICLVRSKKTRIENC